MNKRSSRFNYFSVAFGASNRFKPLRKLFVIWMIIRHYLRYMQTSSLALHKNSNYFITIKNESTSSWISCSVSLLSISLLRISSLLIFMSKRQLIYTFYITKCQCLLAMHFHGIICLTQPLYFQDIHLTFAFIIIIKKRNNYSLHWCVSILHISLNECIIPCHYNSILSASNQ